MNIEGVDLNLLGPLAALLEERHVSRAAERQHMSQPAMSRALRELRAVFDDELLVRSAGAYQLTPRAERLQRELAETLPRLQSLFSIEPFDPRNAGHTFRLASSDFLLSVIAPPLLRQALAQSPGSTFRFDGWSDTVYLDAERGALDIVFTGGAAPPPLRSEPLFEDSYSCLLSAEHPLARAAAPTLDAYLDYDHVVINIAEGRQGAVDIRLGALGRPRRANVTVPYHALAAAVVQDTNLVATLPNRLTERSLCRRRRVRSALPQPDIGGHEGVLASSARAAKNAARPAIATHMLVAERGAQAVGPASTPTAGTSSLLAARCETG